MFELFDFVLQIGDLGVEGDFTGGRLVQEGFFGFNAGFCCFTVTRLEFGESLLHRKKKHNINIKTSKTSL